MSACILVRINFSELTNISANISEYWSYIHVSDLPVRLSWQNLFSLRKSRCGYERFLYLPSSRNWIVEDNVCEANNYRWTRMWTSQYFATMWDRLSLGKDTSLVLLEPIYNIQLEGFLYGRQSENNISKLKDVHMAGQNAMHLAAQHSQDCLAVLLFGPLRFFFVLS